MKFMLICKSMFPCLLLLQSTCSQSQDLGTRSRLAGGPCEGCEAIFEYGTKGLAPVDTLPGFVEASQKLRISGTVYQPDGITPAENVVLYIYQTDESGYYATKGDERGWGRRHGYIRGWIKTGADGRYAFFTQKPGIYPNRTEPAHIHLTLLEPDGKYYYLEDYHFEGDPLLQAKGPPKENPRGGATGIIPLLKAGDILTGKRDIILGKNIPDYEY